MSRTKFVFSIVLATVFLAAQVFAVAAAPARQDTPPTTITGIVSSVVPETDSNGAETGFVIVTLEDGQVFRMTVEYAIEKELLNEDGTVKTEAVGTSVDLDSTQVTPVEPTGTEDEEQHPVGTALSDFFSDMLGVDYDTIMEYHDEGVGFGVIAQALWMTNALEGDSEMFATILDAKLNNDYSGIELPDGSTPENWGQFRKAVMHDREKAKENLGAIMSGHANNGQGDETPTQDQTQTQDHGNGNNDKNKDKDNNGNGNDKNKDKGNNGNGNDKPKGNPHN